MAISLATAETMRDAYVAAEQAVLNSQSYTMNGRVMTKANLKEIRDGRREWQEIVDSLNSGGIQLIGAVPS